MTNWISARRRTYDNLGLLLQRSAGLFVGLGIGAGLPHYFPNVAFLLSKFGILVGLGFLAIAYFRAKAASQSSVEVQTK
jgi:uncharacterized membrane protein YccC